MRPVKRSFTIEGHRTSISLEASFWSALKDVAHARRVPLAQVVGEIDQARGTAGLSSAVRVWLLEYFRQCAQSDAAACVNRKSGPSVTTPK